MMLQVYDTNNDGVLREDDLRDVLKAMIIENGMEFNDEEVQHVPQGSISHKAITTHTLKGEAPCSYSLHGRVQGGERSSHS